MPVAALDGAVLVRDTAVVAGGQHAEMGDERLEASGEVVDIEFGEVAERRRKATAAVLARGAPPSRHSARSRPLARAAKLSLPSTTSICSKPEQASAK